MLFTLVKAFSVLTMFLTFFLLNFTLHPMTIGITVILQSITVSILLTMFSSFTWLSFILLMIYLGGILMIFSYIISITFSTEKLIYKVSMNYLMVLIISLPLSNFKEEWFSTKSKPIQEQIFSCYSSSYYITLFLMIILLILMMIVVFMNESSKSIMRPL